ncbi:hypothetical protein [Pseudomonas sp.]|uniref:hypothetical protein n=1 Tax=Pseudomonas sp. TaxID=306 RepID=UPI0028A903A2|nr:hypothetical protein [Pseudomonas sp.]
MNDATEAIRAYLTEELMPLGLNPDAVFVNEVADVVELEVVRTRTLVEEAAYWLEQREEPTYDQGLFGLFQQRGTFDPAHRLGSLRLSDFERLIGRLLAALG